MYSPLHVLNNRLHSIFHNNLAMISATFIKNELFEVFYELCSPTRRLRQNLGEKNEKTFAVNLKKFIFQNIINQTWRNEMLLDLNRKVTRTGSVHQYVKVVADEGTEVTVQQETHERIYYNILKKKCNFIFFYSLLPNG